MGDQIRGEPRSDPAVILRGAVDTLRKNFDAIDGGWGGAPKFPQPVTLELLLREHLRTAARDPLTMVEKSLDAMATGGIYDHLGGGFARYATDKAWLVPHFEKMLYDNAQLARLYCHAAQVTGSDHYRYVARETLDFVAHELRNPPAGGFASSLDADTDGQEGRTYVWRAAQIHEILGQDAPLFESAYGVTPHGNWEGHTILHRVRSDTDLAVEFERQRDEVRESLAEARVKLLRARDDRPQPARDDKVLTSWNGLMIGAFADAGIGLAEPALVDIAREAADFILANLRTADGRLRRSWKDGRAQHAATLEDYAHLAEGLLTLYDSTFDERYFKACRELAEAILDHFRAEDGGFHDTADDAETLFARPRNVQDNAIPSGGAMATTVLLRLAALTGEGRYRSAAEAALPPIITLAAKHPSGLAQWLIAYQLASTPIDEIAIIGDAKSDDTKALLAVARARYRPSQVLALTSDPATSDVPLLHDRSTIDGAATAYVCQGFACRQPTTDPTDLAGQLQGTPAS